jgi:deoxyribodipyrimidine photo-lyase
MDEKSPILLWFRRDLRLADHPAVTAAIATGRPVIPVFILDPETEAIGAAALWRLEAGLKAFDTALGHAGSRLVLRRGEAQACLRALVTETGATSVYWSRLYDPAAKARDTRVKATLRAQEIDAQSFAGHLLFEPWTVQTKAGGFFRVYTPLWKSVRDRAVAAPAPAPAALRPPVAGDGAGVGSDRLDDWGLGRAMRRGAAVIAPHAQVGSAAAQSRLDTFTANWVAAYDTNRDLPSVPGTSLLSENLALGEIGVRDCWHAGQRALAEGKAGAETFLKELVWREFAYHLMHHTPHILTDNWRPEWDAFPWITDAQAPSVLAWKQGRTGLPFVDAAMREMYVTGRMHNRGRMIVASYLTKHLLVHWKIGRDWFAECLTDWDPASNAMGWQWSAGSGPDATPYFRVFNPETQLDKFDKNRNYVDRWIAEGRENPSATALSYFDAIPESWNLSPLDKYPAPIVTPAQGRLRALEAYKGRGF